MCNFISGDVGLQSAIKELLVRFEKIFDQE